MARLQQLAGVWRCRRGDGAFPRTGEFLVGAIVALGIAIEVQGAFFRRTADPWVVAADLAAALGACRAWRTVRN